MEWLLLRPAQLPLSPRSSKLVPISQLTESFFPGCHFQHFPLIKWHLLLNISIGSNSDTSLLPLFTWERKYQESDFYNFTNGWDRPSVRTFSLLLAWPSIMNDWNKIPHNLPSTEFNVIVTVVEVQVTFVTLSSNVRWWRIQKYFVRVTVCCLHAGLFILRKLEGFTLRLIDIYCGYTKLYIVATTASLNLSN